MPIVALLLSTCTEPVPAPVSPLPSESNQPPVIVEMERSEEGKLRTWNTTTITCVAEDMDGDPLSYVWSATGGKVTGEDSGIGWIAPGVPGDYIIHVRVLDGKGGEANGSITITVFCCGND